MANEPNFKYTQHSSRSDLNQYVAALTGNLIVICSGMHSAWPSPTLPQLLKETSTIPITSSEGSWLAAMPCFGAPLGAISSALLVDRIGRKGCMLLCSPVFLIAWLSIAYSQSLLVLIIARFLVGIADGIVYTVYPMYVAEISHHSVRGRLGSSITVAFNLGLLLVNTLGIYCSIATTAQIGAILPIMHFVTFFWMPESPVYIMTKHKEIKIDGALQKLAESEDIHKDLVAGNTYENATSKLLSLFLEKGTRKALLISVGLRIVQQFSGCFVIFFYCLMIFNEAGGALSGSAATIIYFSIQLISSTFSTALVDKAGRRVLLMCSTIGSGLTLATQGAYFYIKNETKLDITNLGFVPLTALVLYNILFNFGLSALPTLVISELFSTRVKGVALCVCDICFAIVVLLATKFFQIFKDMFGMHVPFIAFASCCAMGLVFVIYCVPETKNKTLNEIQVELNC